MKKHQALTSTAAAVLLGQAAFAAPFQLRSPSGVSYSEPTADLQHDAQELTRRLMKLDAERKDITRKLESARWPFPDDYPTEHQPDTLLTKLEWAAAALEREVRFHTVDCSEYPCLFVGETRGGAIEGIWEVGGLKAVRQGHHATVFHEHQKTSGREIVAFAVFRSPLKEALQIRIDRRLERLDPCRQ